MQPIQIILPLTVCREKFDPSAFGKCDHKKENEKQNFGFLLTDFTLFYFI